MQPLIDCPSLAGRLDAVRLCDIRWALVDPNHGKSAYEDGHIPGAVFVDLDTDLSAAPGPGRHPLPTVDTFAKTLGRLGITPGDEVVVYDAFLFAPLDAQRAPPWDGSPRLIQEDGDKDRD